MRSPVTAVIQLFNALTKDEKKLCLDFIAPEPEPEPRAEQPKKRRTRKPRTGLPAQASDKKDKEAEKVEGSNGADLEPEEFGPRCGVCGHGEQYQDHFQPSPNYHPFDAPVADKKLKKKRADANITQSSETSATSALSVSGD